MSSRLAAAALALAVVACGASTTTRGGTQPATAPAPDAATLEAAARADSVRQHYTRADVSFMTGMIHHHAQALVMSRMASTHGASPSLRTLAARIINGQRDEIRLMQEWLRDRGEPVPEVDPDGAVHMPAARGGHGHHQGHGGQDAVPMAGMLTPAQMRRLDAARGAEWDRLFLTYMIQHHQGALVMVDALFATPGAGQGDLTFKIAADIGADQASEIDRMQRMLQALVFPDGTSR